jgi:hypothetical protein
MDLGIFDYETLVLGEQDFGFQKSVVRLKVERMRVCKALELQRATVPVASVQFAMWADCAGQQAFAVLLFEVLFGVSICISERCEPCGAVGAGDVARVAEVVAHVRSI